MEETLYDSKLFQASNYLIITQWANVDFRDTNSCYAKWNARNVKGK